MTPPTPPPDSENIPEYPMQRDTERVCAVVVTFNRKALLARCLDALLRQQRALNEIVVVDNASTDGTAELLVSSYPQLQRLILDRNRGGAGGFRAGMQWAYERGFDWLWVMDDDIEAYPDALLKLLRWRNMSEFIHAGREDARGNRVGLEGMWDLYNLTIQMFPGEPSHANGKSWTAITWGNFEGAFIHRRIVERIGLPDERYFQGGDDMMYGWLASFHTNVIYVAETAFRRLLPAPVTRNRLTWYLHMRNAFLNAENLRATGVRITRPQMAGFLIRHVGWGLRLLVAVPEHRRWHNFTALWQGVRDGIRGKWGTPPWL